MYSLKLPLALEGDAGACPFKIGEWVYYTPTFEGYAKTYTKPLIGQKVEITEVVQGRYIVYKGYADAAGGIYWSEFSAVPPAVLPF